MPHFSRKISTRLQIQPKSDCMMMSFRITPRPPLFAFVVERALFALREREPHEEELFQFPPALRQSLQLATYIFLRPHSVSVSTMQHAMGGSRPAHRSPQTSPNESQAQRENENRTRRNRPNTRPPRGSKVLRKIVLEPPSRRNC